MTNKNLFLQFLVVFLVTATFSQSFGHKRNQNYVYLRIHNDRVEAEVQLTKRDLNKVLGLKLKEQGDLTSVEANLDVIQKYVTEHLEFRSVNGVHPIKFKGVDIFSLRKDGAIKKDYVLLDIILEGIDSTPDYLDISNTMMVNELDQHESWVTIFYHWKAGIFDNETLPSLIYVEGSDTERLTLTEVSLWKGFRGILGLGIYHIWIGWDHIMFIIALLLPAVVIFTSHDNKLGPIKYRATEPVEQFKPAFFYILKIITLFTVAHSITLSISALELLVFPSTLVESLIALSIGAAAYHNIRPIFIRKEWLIAFGFGLFHGFGFASVLAERAMRGEFYGLTLLGFNLGVEIGQVAIIVVVFPILFLLRRWKYYAISMLVLSILLIMASLLWVFERSLGFDIPVVDLLLSPFT